jgi:omega-6 fatty acid desaturase / acyl-lipid omega-6 desaturase (Delta-12 desaturase)
LIACIYKTAVYLDSLVHPEFIQLPYPILYGVSRFAIWAFYTFAAGLVMTGLWVIAHECGHQAFSESKHVNNFVGYILHSGYIFSSLFNLSLVISPITRLGVPYHSWRITHGKHHASTGHMDLDQVFVPKTRSQMGLPPLNPAREDLLGANVTDEVKQEIWEALGDSPIGATLTCASYLVS